jgi:TRAP-type C4-dicarboxylate transport system permease small subunit
MTPDPAPPRAALAPRGTLATAIDRTAHILERILEAFVVFLVVLLTVLVIYAVLMRIFGASPSWYDEVAAIFLSWITYYGAALAALKRRHIGLDSVLLAIPMPARMGAVIVAEVLVIGFFVLLADAGLEVLMVLEGMRLTSLTWVPVQFTQSVIPIGAALFIVCELLSLPAYWRATAAGVSLEHAEIEDEVESELAKAEAAHRGAR